MPGARPDPLAQPLKSALGTRAANLLATLDLTTVGDLLRHYPRRYIQPGELTDLSALREDENVTLQATVVSVDSRRMRNRRGSLTNVVISDGVSTGHVTFFNQPWLDKQLRPGMAAIFSGKVGRYRGKLQLASPMWFNIADDEKEPDLASDPLAAGEATAPIAVYPAGEKIKSMQIRKQILGLLRRLRPAELVDPIPGGLIESRDLPGLYEAFEAVHRPMTIEQTRSGLARFKFEEALALQTQLLRRRHRAADLPAVRRPGKDSGGLLAAFDAQLPFELTGSQRTAGDEIAADLAGGHPMNRLLHGEVGSGKTVVAVRAMLQIVDSGGQAALLAPTEVLAAQHFRSISQLLGDLGAGTLMAGLESDEARTRVGLLTGSQQTAERRRMLLDIISGDIGIVVGTHALIQDAVKFHDLGLVVVDEQHRFGVKQRDALRDKTTAGVRPHTLVMTATPIPRTIAMTVFGDLDTSTLTELPNGEKKIDTYLVSLNEHAHWWDRIWERVREEVDTGRQVYVVAPRIGDEDTVDPAAEPAASVSETVALLRGRPELEGTTIEMLHGRMSAETKNRLMTDFAAGRIDVLVSTTVIEVGVDVANAKAMVILDAERFGVAALHQLRGRVGRGKDPGLCFLVTSSEPGTPGYSRLTHVAATLDGFELSKLDVESRREGDVLGNAQSGGKSGLKLLRVLKDERLIADARRAADALVADDPELDNHPALNAFIGDVLGHEDEEYLERG
ncbi:ATP-dependent DNA helicase RecG [Spelaeicoccus albus]|uniref:ATP-dependent DNA helicase RecG n=1 Tax=Spelaeicoccus albus TaxID=1280376 RepID=A0A7Z0D2L1_9MICO|nr:ATP-dependent DNA helicase RecG [Spelaeicoccus albus]NYI67724.1 ATP-dependent DNA helicase RecG [Spelaeicoccus albus]